MSSRLLVPTEARARYRRETEVPRFWPASPELHAESGDEAVGTADKKKGKKEKKKSKRKDKKERKRSRRDRSVSSEDHDRHRKRGHKRRRTRSVSVSSSSGSDVEYREKPVAHAASCAAAPPRDAESDSDDDGGVEVGPAPPTVDAKPLDSRSYGHALLAGEGSAMAAYVQDGKRIPRRGEIGLTGDEIDQYETVGYVMSGSRHQRMNAVRLRKENQVISAEERRKLLLLHAEEKTKKEAAIMADFKELVANKVKQIQK
ncbi:hypothetical protein AMAG_20631 [Allomyces macrogynus ATCC 38327]|uniref:NF-kappa-B-activating protein C-terminal domain-containing protein n=1 Tax=Allomyces macrogynus (strain ATCC 38327) TaxID=578462 RepID=A0A0L0TE86_ALLM3|nr:hypothetical protein AMAG_20631 [Allomyces macrogynus ATCC 38327]|eukprot:KNE72904.1 hypothetical protein AMAG_20631 [Allomyces macrogynus ATCC 38327]